MSPTLMARLFTHCLVSLDDDDDDEYKKARRYIAVVTSTLAPAEKEKRRGFVAR